MKDLRYNAIANHTGHGWDEIKIIFKISKKEESYLKYRMLKELLNDSSSSDHETNNES